MGKPIRYEDQILDVVRCGAYDITVPEQHILVTLGHTQPYRDLGVGIAAKCFGNKYPDGVLVDVGANVGDTAAIMATYAQNPMILVEASTYFSSLLRRNASKFSNSSVIKQAFVSDGQNVSGSLNHWGGTAFLQQQLESNEHQIATCRLRDLAGDGACMIKLDTDGFDFKILLDSIDWFARTKPGLLFENQIRSSEDFNLANKVYSELQAAGYSYFVVWDDAGYHMVSTQSLEVLTDLNRYLYNVNQGKGHISIYNYDVLCVQERDLDVFNSVIQWATCPEGSTV
jgi:FkbM family methyltransferase